jgi:hypothetical protein
MVHGAESVRFLNSTADLPCAIVDVNGVKITGCREGDAVAERKYDVLMFREERIQLRP